MLRRALAIILAFAFVGLFVGGCKDKDETPAVLAGLPTLEVQSTDTPPVIDGNFGDSCWNQASRLGGFISTFGNWSRNQTEGLMTYDDTHLYLAVRCHDTQIDGLVAKVRENDDVTVWRDDCLEIYFDPGNERATFYHLIINSLGTVYDAKCNAQGGRDEQWTAKYQVATASDGDTWVLELAIPFADLGVTKPTSGMAWGFNLNRERHRTEDYSSWSGTTAFNDPAQFGTIIFDTAEPVTASFIYTYDNQSRFVQRTTLTNHTDGTLNLQLAAHRGEQASKPLAITLQPREQTQVDLQYYTWSPQLPERWPLTVNLIDADTGETYLRKQAALEITPPFDLQTQLYYYPADDEPIRLRIRAETGRQMRVSLSHTSSGEAIAEQVVSIIPCRRDYDLTFNANGLAPGRYIASVAGMDEAGREKFALYQVFIRRDFLPPRPIPTPVETVTFNDHGAMLVNGEVIFPLMTSSPDEPTSALADNTFNVCNGNFGELPDAPTRVGFNAFRWGRKNNRAVRIMGTDAEMEQRVGDALRGWPDHGKVLYWDMAYEADSIGLSQDDDMLENELDHVEQFRKINDFIKTISPDRPTGIHVDHLNAEPEYATVCDILDVTVSSSSYGRDMIKFLIRDIQQIRQITGPAKPVFMWLGSAIPHESHRDADEIRCGVYLAMMNGINGLTFHFGHGGVNLSSTRHWSVYRGVAREAEIVYPILMGEPTEAPPTIKVDTLGIDFRVRNHLGKTYLIACNTTGRPANVTFKIESNIRYQDAAIPFEHRVIEISDQGWTDEFMPYEPHVYQLNAKLTN